MEKKVTRKRNELKISTMRFCELLKIAKLRPFFVNEFSVAFDCIFNKLHDISLRKVAAKLIFHCKRFDDFLPYFFLQIVPNDTKNVFHFTHLRMKANQTKNVPLNSNL